ncbi:hypothetical protein EJD97_020995 [Solanum chilense]|uniref:Uncharacterized protein n=1 Tax=Solanum chilense TaxID=4083 RepID=A0A6N2AY48_SOLCI|nr:hypothetical protein EJD97_020995 [Solanum chilense]
MASLTSEFLNFIVVRYLSESGFKHPTFTFGYEARINRSTADGHLVPINALINLVQKVIQYLELETNLSNVRHTLLKLVSNSRY